MDRTVSLSKRLSSGIGNVLVRTTSSTLHALSRSTAGPERMAWVAAMMTPWAPSSMSASAAFVIVPAVDHVIDEHAHAILDLTDDAVRHDLVRPVDVARLVDEGQRRAAHRFDQSSATLIQPASGETTARSRWPYFSADVGRQDRHGHEVVDRPVEEALDLRGVGRWP